jgi:hypothetical protein
MMKKPMDDDIENVGIMRGFMDSMHDGEDDEDMSMDEDEGVSMPEMERSPKSPEILMNNLRGDMRSVDARRDELADLVGYQAATETPESVLAMLQPVLAAQGGAGGIGALPQSQPMAQGPQPPMPPGGVGAPMGGPLPPGGIAGAPGMPPGAAPMPPGAGMPPPQQGAPMGMAHGGYVQHFQVGSSPAGVTPAETDSAAPGADQLALYPPELVNAARTQMQGLITQQPQVVPTLGQLMEKRLPEYQSLLGADKGRGMAEAQMLLDLGQRAFNFASNTDDAGRPLRGGFFARLAGAAKTLPGAMGKHIEAMNNIDLKLKTLALQASEKDQDQVVAQNTKLLSEKRAVFTKILDAQAKVDAQKIKGLGSSIFGKGDWEWNVVNMPGLMDRYAAGQTDDTENKIIDSAITKFKTPRYETHFDPVSKQPYTKTMPVMIPSFVTTAEAARKKLGLTTPATPSLVPSNSVSSNDSSGATSDTTTAVPTEGGEGGAPATASSVAPVAPSTGTLPQVSLWKERFNIAGPVSASIGLVSSIPGLGDPAAHITLARQQAQQQAERVIDSLMKSTAGSVREQERLRPVIGIIPSATTDPDAYGTKLIALGSTLQDMIREYDAQGRSKELKPEDVGFARRRAMDLRRQYNMLGLPPAVYSEAEYKRYPAGTEVLWMGRTPAQVK